MPFVLKSGSLNHLKSSGPIQAVGLLYLFTISIMKHVLACDWDSSAVTSIYLLCCSNDQGQELYMQCYSVIALSCIFLWHFTNYAVYNVDIYIPLFIGPFPGICKTQPTQCSRRHRRQPQCRRARSQLEPVYRVNSTSSSI